MKVPSINFKTLKNDIKELIDTFPTRDMYKIALNGIDEAMKDLVDIREEMDNGGSKIKKMLENWDKAFTAFGEREAYYYKAFIDSNDRKVVDAPLFDGDYSEFDFESPPTNPDIETPWRLANDVVMIAIEKGEDEGYVTALANRFKNGVARFWDEVNRLLIIEKEKFEQIAQDEDEGRKYGFLPVLAVTAVAAVGLLGAAIGYSRAKEERAGDYIDTDEVEKYKTKAKYIGLGLVFGLGLGLLWWARKRD